MVAVKTVRDFTQIFDAYSKFMERVTSLKMNELTDAKPNEMAERETELELYMSRFEHLMDRRPLLLNSVLLRQNPHNVHEWLNRVEIYESNPEMVSSVYIAQFMVQLLQFQQVHTFNEAVKTVDPKQQVGKLSALWIAFGKLYENLNSMDEARRIFEQAILVDLVKVDELANIWCEYVEFELRHR